MKINLLALVFALFFSTSAIADKSAFRSPETVDGAITTTLAQAKRLFDEGTVFVDVRNPRFYASGHIPRAYHLDFKYNYDEEKLLAVADKTQPLVIYCSGVKCSRSYRASAKAVSWGFQTVHYFRGGIADWKTAGYPVVVTNKESGSAADK